MSSPLTARIAEEHAGIERALPPQLAGAARRRAAIAPYVLSEQEGFYRGRELIVPEQP